MKAYYHEYDSSIFWDKQIPISQQFFNDFRDSGFVMLNPDLDLEFSEHLDNEVHLSVVDSTDNLLVCMLEDMAKFKSDYGGKPF
jgi:hypothetical protein